jgi:hypothetical protein
LREELKLELNQEKSLITHARTGAARFLGYEITVQHSRDRPQVNGGIALRVPKDVIKAKCAPYVARGKPERRTGLLNLSDLLIVGSYGAEYRGVVQYYLLAGNVSQLNRLEWVASTSMLKTLAAKHGSTVRKMARKYKAKILTPYGPRTCFEASQPRAARKPLVTRFGGLIPLKRQRKAVLDDRLPVPATGRKELITGLLAGRCEWCRRDGTVEVDQVRALADLAEPGQPQPAWALLMATMRRKTLVVCTSCHGSSTAGSLTLHSRHSRWRATCRETGPRGSDRGSLERTCLMQAPRQRPTGVKTARPRPHRAHPPHAPVPGHRQRAAPCPVPHSPARPVPAPDSASSPATHRPSPHARCRPCLPRRHR